MVFRLTQIASIICASNLLAFHIEIALDPATAFADKMVAKARIHALLTYLHDIGSRWCIAKWTSRVAEWVVRKAGLMLSAPSYNDRRESTGLPQQQQRPSATLQNQHFDNNEASVQEHLQFVEGAFAFDVNTVLPDQWMQDFLGESFFGQFDDGLLNTS